MGEWALPHISNLMNDAVVVGGPPPRRFPHTCPTAVQLLAPWYDLLTEDERLGFHRDLSLLTSQWRETAEARVERTAATVDLAVC